MRTRGDTYHFKKKDSSRPKREKFDAYRDITEAQHRKALEAAFAKKEAYGYQELADRATGGLYLSRCFAQWKQGGQPDYHTEE